MSALSQRNKTDYQTVCYSYLHFFCLQRKQNT